MPATTRKGKSLDVRDWLLKKLSEVDRPGTFCASGDLPLTMPGLVVEGVGAVRLPLGRTQARQLVKMCRQAPYGKGTETLVDTDVRRVWELDPDRFRLTNPKWGRLVDSILADVQRTLGLQDCKLAARLYKLLLYAPGGFFLPHRDGEKLDRMVATMVIGLPSVHDGGELIVSHDHQQAEIALTGAALGHELSYAAFYADCQHEVRRLRSGYRLCLTYNVTLAKTRGKQGVVAPSYGATAAAIGERLGDWRKGAAVQKLAVTLDHRYTEDGLTLDTLKGVDRARAEVLFEAAERADCVAHLALVTLWQSGSAESDHDEYSYGRGRGYSWSDDEEEDHDERASRYEMGEIYEYSLSADHWSDRQGNKVRFGQIGLSQEEIVSTIPLDECEANREDFEGYTGNAGMTLERWYHRAAVVLWPRERHFSALCDAGTDAAIGGLETMVRRLRRAAESRREQLRETCRSFAEAIIDSWQAAPRRRWDQRGDEHRTAFPAMLCELDDPPLVRRFLTEVLIDDEQAQLDQSFARFCKKHGWKTFEAELTAVIESTTVATLPRSAELLRVLCQQRDKTPERVRLCTRLSNAAVEALETLDRKREAGDWRARTVDRAALLCSLVKAMQAIDAEKPLSRLIAHALASERYALTEAHLAAIFKLERPLVQRRPASVAITTWLDAVRGQLEHRTANTPRKPADYRRAHKLSCKCSDCRRLSDFLADPDERQTRFPLAKQRRQHLHQVIDRDGCDLTHVTERRGSPYTLVCTKTMASYETACKIHARDLENLSRVIKLSQKVVGERGRSPRPRSA